MTARSGICGDQLVVRAIWVPNTHVRSPLNRANHKILWCAPDQYPYIVRTTEVWSAQMESSTARYPDTTPDVTPAMPPAKTAEKIPQRRKGRSSL